MLLQTAAEYGKIRKKENGGKNYEIRRFNGCGSEHDAGGSG